MVRDSERITYLGINKIGRANTKAVEFIKLVLQGHNCDTTTNIMLRKALEQMEVTTKEVVHISKQFTK